LSNESRRMRRLLLVSSFLLAACPPPATGGVTLFKATPASIEPGDSATLEWKARNADSCQLSPGFGKVAATGVAKVTPTETTTYELRCGKGVARQVVTVTPAVRITTFTATPQTTVLDGVVTLAWSADFAGQCYLDPGDFKVDATGTKDVQVAADTEYVFTCEGQGGPVESKLTVTATPATALDAPTNLRLTGGDGSLTLDWDQTTRVSADVYLAEAPGIDRTTWRTLPGGTRYVKVLAPLTLTGLVNGRTYYARVSAASGTLESALSDEASGAPVASAPAPDTFAAEEWHLINVGQHGGTPGQDLNVTGAWSQTRGEGVRIAVVDEGVDLGHRDLAVNVATLMSYDYLGNAPVKLAEHGTCVAGLAAARDENGRGVRGVAPRANIVSYNVLQDLTSSHEYDSMVRGMDRNAASNNSWGDAADGTGLLSRPDPLWLMGVAKGTAQGRGGKGVVYLWAAGNGGDSHNLDNANYDGQANARFVFAIGGVGDDGRKASYSEDGANVLVVTPTEGRAGHALTTTDDEGAFGYNDGTHASDLPDGDYTNTMNGTSGATPEATGAVALILAANPDLTWRDVRRVLAYSARKNDPTDGDWVLNGAGLHVNHKYGFGVIDAAAAVTLAKTFTPGAPEVSFTAPTVSPNAAIPDGDPNGVSSFVDVSNSGVGHVEFVEVTVTVPHTRTGDLELRLEKQGGTFDLLHVPHSCGACSDIDGYTFGSVRHLDEPGDGRWTLKATDTVTGETGTLANWTLSLHGRP